VVWVATANAVGKLELAGNCIRLVCGTWWALGNAKVARILMTTASNFSLSFALADSLANRNTRNTLK
jgi:hypothetical protein